MADFIADWNACALVWGDRMWAVLWQSTLFAILVALVSVLFLRRSSPGVRCWIWQVVAIKLLVMPFWTYAIPLTEIIPVTRTSEPAGTSAPSATSKTLPGHYSKGPSAPVQNATGQNATVPTMAKVKPSPDVQDSRPAETSFGQISWRGWLLGTWAIILAVQCVRIFWQHGRLARLLRQATGADATLAALVGETACRLGLRRVPQAVLTEVDCSPFVCGIRRAVLVLPRELTATLSATELNHVLLHELAHVRRLDLVWGWIGEMARMVYFFHPVVHWIAYRIRLERELACDQLAMATSGQGAAEYAATLVRVVSQSSEPSVFKTSAASASLNGDTP
jgi:beta-lactamase regulating signal transducer with metallopeptidase domain